MTPGARKSPVAGHEAFVRAGALAMAAFIGLALAEGAEESVWRVKGLSPEGLVEVARRQGDQPTWGDGVEVFFEVPGLGQRARKAAGRITSIAPDRFLVWVNRATSSGEVAQGDGVAVVARAAEQAREDAVAVLSLAPRKWLGMARYRTMADAGDPDGVYRIAEAFGAGIACTADPARYAMWLERAAMFGHLIGKVKVAALAARDGNGDAAVATMREALPALEGRASAGDPWAQVWLGRCLAEGWGVARNAESATQWFQRSASAFRPLAEAGDVFAAWELAGLYDRGQGVAADPGASARWLRVAAEGGFPNAQDWLGDRLLKGEGVARDPREARNWLQKAALQDMGGAQDALASLLASASAGTADLTEARAWAHLAAEKNFRGSLDALSAKMSAQDTAAAERRAEELRAAIARAGGDGQ